MNGDDILKLEAVKDYTPSELMTIIIFLEGGMFCDRFGRPYTREYIKKNWLRFIGEVGKNDRISENQS